jgi:hypothetical protein
MGVDDWRLGRFGVGDLPVGAAVSMASTGSTRMPRAGSPRIWKLTFCVFILPFVVPVAKRISGDRARSAASYLEIIFWQTLWLLLMAAVFRSVPSTLWKRFKFFQCWRIEVA